MPAAKQQITVINACMDAKFSDRVKKKYRATQFYGHVYDTRHEFVITLRVFGVLV